MHKPSTRSNAFRSRVWALWRWIFQFEGCNSLKAVSAPPELAAGLPAGMFKGCGTAPSALLAAGCYWSRQSHRLCSPVVKEAVFAVVLVCLRQDRESESQQPALPLEIWCFVLEFVLRYEFGSA